MSLSELARIHDLFLKIRVSSVFHLWLNTFVHLVAAMAALGENVGQTGLRLVIRNATAYIIASHVVNMIENPVAGECSPSERRR